MAAAPLTVGDHDSSLPSHADTVRYLADRAVACIKIRSSPNGEYRIVLEPSLSVATRMTVRTGEFEYSVIVESIVSAQEFLEELRQRSTDVNIGSVEIIGKFLSVDVSDASTSADEYVFEPTRSR